VRAAKSRQKQEEQRTSASMEAINDRQESELLAGLYEAWGKPEKAKEWRAKLDAQASPEPRQAQAAKPADPRR
jgi:hypothetical protein